MYGCVCKCVFMCVHECTVSVPVCMCTCVYKLAFVHVNVPCVHLDFIARTTWQCWASHIEFVSWLGELLDPTLEWGSQGLTPPLKAELSCHLPGMCGLSSPGSFHPAYFSTSDSPKSQLPLAQAPSRLGQPLSSCQLWGC